MLKIEDLQLVSALAQAPSLSAAARALNVTPPALSMRLRKLEAALGLALAVRTARRLSLTPEGERFAREAAALLAQLQALPESLQRDDSRLAGTLRIAAPFGYGRRHIAPVLARLALRHPGLRVQLDLRETPWPDHHDADAVVHIGVVRDSDLAALLAQLQALPESLQRDDSRLAGTLRIAAPFGYGRRHIAPVLARLALRHPGLRVQLDLRETPWPDHHDADAVVHIGVVRD